MSYYSQGLLTIIESLNEAAIKMQTLAEQANSLGHFDTEIFCRSEACEIRERIAKYRLAVQIDSTPLGGAAERFDKGGKNG